jgi:hypothetical protein
MGLRMPAIDHAVVQGFVDAGLNGANTAQQGRALEDLVCYVFGLVPGIAITHRNALNTFATEEIDVALFNESANEGFHFLPNLILVECKNWSNRVSSAEVAWFLTKLRNRGLDFGILVSTRGITGDADDLTAAHHIVATALLERRRLIVLTTDELLALADTQGLSSLIKRKLCELAVTGSIR